MVGIRFASSLRSTDTSDKSFPSPLAKRGVHGAYVPKGGFNTKTLIFAAETVIPLPSDQLQILGDQVVQDVRAAGQCLVFALPTAVGFHIFRAVEAVVLQYFPLIRFRPKPSERNLGRYINALKEAGVDERIVGMLTHLKDFYRNPLAHPEPFLTPQEALGLFGFAPSAIAAMAVDIDAIRNKQKVLTSRPKRP